jgi:nucleoside permease NupC
VIGLLGIVVMLGLAFPFSENRSDIRARRVLCVPLWLERLASLPFRSLMWLIGIPWGETAAPGALIGDSTRSPAWEFARWYPACWPPAPAGPGRVLSVSLSLR